MHLRFFAFQFPARFHCGFRAAVVVDGLLQLLLCGDLILHGAELPTQGVHSAVALMHGFIQTVKVDQAVVRQEIVGSRHLFEVMDFRPFLIADAFSLGFLGFNIHHAPNGGGLRCALLRGVPAGSTLDGR